MQVRDILDGAPEFPTTVTDATVQKAAKLMTDADVRAVAVVEGDRLVGILTDWDIVHAFVSKAGELADMPVSAVMTGSNLITIDASETVATASEKLRKHRVHHLPVLDGDKYRGMICLGLEWTEEGMLTPPLRPTLTARHP